MIATPNMGRTFRTKKIEREWLPRLRLLPNFDPLAQAEGYYFDEKAAAHACDFFPRELCHPTGAKQGQPFELSDWQYCFIANLFGWKRIDNCARRFREVLVYVAKKNGKSTLIAGIVLYVQTQDGEYGAQLYSAASSRDQAALIYDFIVGMIRQNSELESRLTIYGARGGAVKKQIYYAEMMSRYTCLTAEVGTADGCMPHLAAVDELHRHMDGGKMARMLQKSTATRLQPIVLYMTTADTNRDSICNDTLRYGRAVCSNKGDRTAPGWDPAFLPCIYEPDQDDPWDSPDTWRKSNPNLGVTLTMEFLERECSKAKLSPSEIQDFKRYHANMVVDSETAYIARESWDPLAVDLSLEDFRGRPCFMGLDLSSTSDTTAIGIAAPPVEDDQKWLYWVHYFLPEDQIEKLSRKHALRYEELANEGMIELTIGSRVDQDTVKSRIVKLAESLDVRDIAFDPWQAEKLAQELEMQHGLTTVKYRQGTLSMSEPTKTFETIVVEGNCRHAGNPLLGHQVGGMAVKMDADGNIKPAKDSSKATIDGVVALIMATGRGLSLVEGESVYETRGYLTV